MTVITQSSSNHTRYNSIVVLYYAIIDTVFSQRISDSAKFRKTIVWDPYRQAV